jgi:hypothetical protein
MSRSRSSILPSTLAWLCCCVTSLQLEGQTLDAYNAALADAEDNDVVMHRMNLGLAALQAGAVDVARQNFDVVLQDIESVYSNTEAALQARSLWYEEGQKSFKGEPYERAMAYYYRGLIYLMDQDFDNARASFLAGQLQDAFAEEDQHRADFALLMLMEAWAAGLMGEAGLADDALADFRVLRPDLPVPSPQTHALVLIETGTAPRKLRDGVSGESLVYRRGKNFTDRYAFVRVPHDGAAFDADAVEDLFYQAATRGERVVDRINEGKAVYKSAWTDGSSSVANIANQMNLVNNMTRDYSQFYTMETGIEMAPMHVNVNFGSFALAASVVSMMASKIKPKADNRSWSNLPDAVHVAFVPLDVLADNSPLDMTLVDDHRQDMKEIALPLVALSADARLGWYKVHGGDGDE